MNLVLQHLLLQLSALFFGILGGAFIVWFCVEELSLYRKQIKNTYIIFTFLMLIVPVLYYLSADLKVILPFLVLFSVYAALFFKSNKDDLSQGFFYIAALVLFLASNELQLFFLTLSLFVFAVFCLVLLHEKTKMSTLHFFGEHFSGFIVLTAATYGLTWVSGLF